MGHFRLLAQPTREEEDAPARRETTIESLHDDLLSSIAHELSVGLDGAHAQRQELHRFALVSRRFARLSRAHRFHAVRLGTTQSEEAFLQTLLRDPSLIPFVHELSIGLKRVHWTHLTLLMAASLDLRKLVLRDYQQHDGLRLRITDKLKESKRLTSLEIDWGLGYADDFQFSLSQGVPSLRKLRIGAFADISFFLGLQLTHLSFGDRQTPDQVENYVNVSVSVWATLEVLEVSQLFITELTKALGNLDITGELPDSNLRVLNVTRGVANFLDTNWKNSSTFLIDVVTLLHLCPSAPLCRISMDKLDECTLIAMTNAEWEASLSVYSKSTLQSISLNLSLCQDEGHEGFLEDMMSVNGALRKILRAFPPVEHLRIDGIFTHYHDSAECATEDELTIYFPLAYALIAFLERTNLLEARLDQMRCFRQSPNERWTKETFCAE